MVQPVRGIEKWMRSFSMKTDPHFSGGKEKGKRKTDHERHRWIAIREVIADGGNVSKTKNNKGGRGTGRLLTCRPLAIKQHTLRLHLLPKLTLASQHLYTLQSDSLPCLPRPEMRIPPSMLENNSPILEIDCFSLELDRKTRLPGQIVIHRTLMVPGLPRGITHPSYRREPFIARWTRQNSISNMEEFMYP